MVILISKSVTAQSTTSSFLYYGDADAQTDWSITPSIQYDAITPITAMARPVNGGQTELQIGKRQNRKPLYLQVAAGLVNFDRDAEPDGWNAELVLRDENDLPVIMRANAKFELEVRPEYSSNRRAIEIHKPIVWSKSLTFDDRGVARVRLPLRGSLKPKLGWPPGAPMRSGIRSRSTSVYSGGLRYQNRRQLVLTSDLVNHRTIAEYGLLRVRVSVPTQGVFEADATVLTRPPVLVDTHWPYR